MNADGFTERAHKVFAQAQHESAELNHEYVGTEHLLLALFATADGVMADLIHNLGVNVGEVRESIYGIVKRGKSENPPGHVLPFTSRTIASIDLAQSEARDLNQNQVDSEHLLLGLVCEEKGIAAQVLYEAGVTKRKLRGEIRRILGKEPTLASESKVVGVLLEIRLADTSVVRLNFPNTAAAAKFLSEQ